MTPKKSDNWEVKVVAYDGVTLAPDGKPTGDLTKAEIDKLLTTLTIFGESAGKKLNDMEICPSELTVAGNVSLDVGGNILLFGVSAGISVSMTWKFSTESPPRGGRGH